MNDLIKERMYRPWYKDRDFSEVKSGNDDVVAVIENPEQLQRILYSHNILLGKYQELQTDKIYYVEGRTGGIFDRITWQVAAFLSPIDASEYCAALNRKVAELGLNEYSNEKPEHWNLQCELQKYDPRAHNDQGETEYHVYELDLIKFFPQGRELPMINEGAEGRKHSSEYIKQRERDASLVASEEVKQ